MKANEIQIGDWLYYKGRFNAFPFKVESITKKKVGYHAEPNEHRMYYLRLSECKPIPLTPEILEKNGFVKGYMFNNVWNYIEDYKRLVIVYTGEVFNIQDTLIEFKHVHELQHILKICGIEKEIIL